MKKIVFVIFAILLTALVTATAVMALGANRRSDETISRIDHKIEEAFRR